MKVHLIKASSGSEFSKYKAETGGPPQNIFSTAAATPEGFEIEMTDETIGMKAKLSSDADIVAIFMSTPDAIRAYELADNYRKQGKTVALGGLHTMFMKDEASEHADTLLLGETEGIWEEFLHDVESGDVKDFYQRGEPLDLAGLKPYPLNILKPKLYNNIWSVVVSRGCANKCEFCLVPEFSGRKLRFRPIENIVEELRLVKKAGVKWVELHSDNLTGNRQYALELFHALAPLKLNFYGETTILIAQDEELLEAAKAAGVKALLFGIETPDEEALKSQGKSFVKPEKIKEYVAKVKSYGIDALGDFLFGFDEHEPEIFDRTWQFTKEIKMNTIYPHLMIPFPGSTTFKKLDAEGRIISRDWSEYDGSHAVFKPGSMTAAELENGINDFWGRMYGRLRTDNSRKMQKRSGRLLSKWKTIIALFLLGASLWFGFHWIFFAVVFLLWSIDGIRSGHAFIVEDVNRNENPVLFWIISIMWIVLSVWSFFSYE